MRIITYWIIKEAKPYKPEPTGKQRAESDMQNAPCTGIIQKI